MKEHSNCGDWTLDPAYKAEWVNRSTQRCRRLLEGGSSAKEQEVFDRIGGEFRDLRISQNQSRNEVAERIGVKPSTLCFFESGWFDCQEFMEVIDHWAAALGLEADDYKHYLSIKQQEGESDDDE